MPVTVIKGVPMPKPKFTVRSTKYPFATMEVDGMFFLPGRTTDKFATYVSLWGRKLGRKFKTRMLTMKNVNKSRAKDAIPEWVECPDNDPKGEYGVGVWRVR